jgi:phosphomannomutase
MKQENLIFTFSGIRGLIGKHFNYEVAKKLAIAFGQNYKESERKVILGRDTRPSGVDLEKGIIEGLIATDFEVVNVGIIPTPVIFHAKTLNNIPAGIIITGSHNSQKWNGLKLLNSDGYLRNEDLWKISNLVKTISIKDYKVKSSKIKQKLSYFDPVPYYREDLKKYIDFRTIKERNKLKVVMDTGAGAGKIVTPQILQDLGCKVKLINNEFILKNTFPREIEPVQKNLKDLIMEVWQGKYDVGFAHDSDADRLAIVGEDGTCYPEDIGLALIMDYYLKNNNQDNEKVIFVTNLASSIMFEVIADNYNAQVIRTPIGEVFLSNEIAKVINKNKETKKQGIVFGGEGSCGGIIFPLFNNTRDGIFAAAKIIEILIKTEQKISQLVSKLPKFYAHRRLINTDNIDISSVISETKLALNEEGEEVVQINNDLRFGHDKEWFILIHPSNTEPVIRVISEAKSDSLARVYCEATTELIKLIIDRI